MGKRGDFTESVIVGSFHLSLLDPISIWDKLKREENQRRNENCFGDS